MELKEETHTGIGKHHCFGHKIYIVNKGDYYIIFRLHIAIIICLLSYAINYSFLIFTNTLTIRDQASFVYVKCDISAPKNKLDASKKALKHMAYLQKIESTENSCEATIYCNRVAL